MNDDVNKLTDEGIDSDKDTGMPGDADSSGETEMSGNANAAGNTGMPVNADSAGYESHTNANASYSGNDATEYDEEYAAADSSATVEAEPEDTPKRGSELFAWVRDIVLAVLIALIISRFVTPTIVQEHSMENTLFNNDYLILWKMAYEFGHEPKYGDIVVFRSDIPDENHDGKKKLLIKRVVAISGDTVAVKDGIVYRNGEPLSEPYTKDGYTDRPMDETVVPDGSLFLLGDNRIVSVDSRSSEVGFVEESRLVGRAVWRLYPFSQFGGIYKNYTPE